MPVITSEPNKIFQEDVAFSASVSEAVGNKIGAVINYQMDRLIRYDFGFSGQSMSGLVGFPYYAVGTSEVFEKNCTLSFIYGALEETGASGTTIFDIQKAPVGSNTFTSILSTTGQITSSASDFVFFYSTGSAPSGVTLPVASTTTFVQGEKLRLVLNQSAASAQNLRVSLFFAPTN